MTNESKPGKLRGGLLLFGVSVGITCVLLELVARAILPAPLPWRYPQVAYVADEALTFRMRPNQLAYTRDKIATINENGVRGPAVPYARQPERTRILFLGDSVMFGHGVEDDEVAAQRVQALLAERGIAAEVINASVPSYNTEQEIAYLAVEGYKYEPDWVVLAYYWNDISPKNTVRVSRDGWLMNEGVDEDALNFFERWWISETGYELRNQVKRIRFLYGAGQGLQALRGSFGEPSGPALARADLLAGRNSPALEAGWRQVDASFARFGELKAQYGFKAAVVVFPIPQAFEGDYPNSRYVPHVTELAQHLDAPILNLEPAFRPEYTNHNSLFIPYDADHPNARGHEVAAQSIAAFLAAQMGADGR